MQQFIGMSKTKFIFKNHDVLNDSDNSNPDNSLSTSQFLHVYLHSSTSSLEDLVPLDVYEQFRVSALRLFLRSMISIPSSILDTLTIQRMNIISLMIDQFPILGIYIIAYTKIINIYTYIYAFKFSCPFHLLFGALFVMNNFLDDRQMFQSLIFYSIMSMSASTHINTTHNR